MSFGSDAFRGAFSGPYAGSFGQGAIVVPPPDDTIFSTDFEEYNVGDYLHEQPEWEEWVTPDPIDAGFEIVLVGLINPFQVASANNGSHATVWSGSFTGDIEVSVTLNSASNGSTALGGIAISYGSAGQFIGMGFNNDFRVFVQDETFTLLEDVSPGWNYEGSGRVTLIGDELTLYTGGNPDTPAVVWTLPSPATGKVGLYNNRPTGTTAHSYDTFEVKQL